MLQLKHLLPTFLRCSVGNGTTASFWFDFWTELGPLHLLFGSTASRTLRLPISATVADAVRDGHWNLPSARSQNAVTLQIVLTTTPVPAPANDKDSFLWRSHTGGFGAKFSSSVTWDFLRQRSPAVEWHEIYHLPTIGSLLCGFDDYKIQWPIFITSEDYHEATTAGYCVLPMARA
ncbi:uncharacterized protein LOC103831481 [Brassica rapa]|uniref:uncharacterized protein LOC106408652 n=1 Tax=Brassica napus TaxID=3708 RepID=UPI0004F15140|nr:uncharacterized protein LOC106408652 [Brassica napus]XP_033131928.1 uncharacterized protein LOC103831481 [Brassica rapa]